MRSRRRQRAASASIRPAQRKTLNSRTVLRRLAMRSRCSAAGIVAARSSASAVSSTWYGLTISASGSSRAAPAKRLSTSTPCKSSRAATNSLHTRFIPSCRLVTMQMSAARNNSLTASCSWCWASTTNLPGMRLVIGGSGWLRPRLEAAAAALGVADRVSFAGFVADAELPRYYQAADLVVLPSVALEGCGLITLEALACGTPVVATPEGGAVDVLSPLEPAWLAKDRSPAALAAAIRAALERLPTDPTVGERCRAHAVGYAWERIVGRYEALYQSVSNAA